MSYQRPDNLTDAFDMLASPGVRVLAGGTDVFPGTQGGTLTGDILDITAVAGLGGISRTTDGWRLGALCTFSQIIAADLPAAFDALKVAAQQVGSVQIQNSATLAGNLCNASPAADGVPPLLILDASLEISSNKGIRQLPLADFITGVRRVDLAQGELLTAIHIPDTATQGHSVFSKLGARKYLVISIAMVALRMVLQAGKITEAAVAVGACSPVAQRLGGLEAALIGAAPDDPGRWAKALDKEIETVLSPISDIRSDADYRRVAAAELINRCIQDAAEAGK